MMLRSDIQSSSILSGTLKMFIVQMSCRTLCYYKLKSKTPKELVAIFFLVSNNFNYFDILPSSAKE